jgi:predicted phosphodiesterase
MKLTDHEIKLKRGVNRVEFFVFGDCHIGKRNCAEKSIRKQVREVLERADRKDREVRVLLGGDICDYVKPGDMKRFNINNLADWMVEGTASTVRKRLNNVADQQLQRALDIFDPLRGHIIGAIEGNHEYSMMHHNNFDMQDKFCHGLGTEDLTDEAMIRLKFRKGTCVQGLKFYLQHGHGGGRTAGAEPNHLARLRDEWEDADVVLRGHSHTFCTLPPKPVMYLPNSGDLPAELLQRYRYAANWGCWLYSHSVGPSSYESRASYPARPMVTMKIVVWPFHQVTVKGQRVMKPKIELREYVVL